MEPNTAANPEPQMPVQPAPEPISEQEIKPKNPFSKWLLVFAVLILLAILFSGVYFLGIYQGQSQKPASKTITSAHLGSPKPTAQAADPTTTWKTYSSTLIGYSIKIPSDWQVDQYNENTAEKSKGVTTTEAFPPGEGAMAQDSFSIGPIVYRDANGNIYKTISTLSDIQANWEAQNYPSSWFVKTTTTRTKIDGFDAIAKEAVWKATPPEGFNGEWSDATNREIYIDLKNGTYIKADEHWKNSTPTMKDDFNQILSTFKFTSQTTPIMTTTTATPTTVIDEMSSWKLYSNPDYPFQIKYSPDWTLRTTYGASVKNVNNDRVAGIDINTGTPGYGSTLIVNVINPLGKTLEDWLRANMSNAYIPTKINYQGNIAYKYQYPTQDNRLATVEIYYQHKDKIIFLAWNLISAVDQPTADQIMSSLEFIQ